MKILTIVGARPQFVKAAIVSRALKRDRRVKEVLVHTGQHYDVNMSRRFFDELEMPKPNYNLGVGSASHGLQTARMIEHVEVILRKEQPDWVLVYGDTNSTLAGALAAVKLHIPIAHVEAGLRSFNRQMPEEINRVLTDHMSELLFAPTTSAMTNLIREGIDGKQIVKTGDVMFDAALFYADKASQTSRILQEQKLNAGTYVLATVHRAENTNDPSRLTIFLEGLHLVTEELPVILPLHPRTRQIMKESNMKTPPSLQVIDPVGYLDMIQLERNAAVIATDSGGVQKEAYFHRVPCVTLRNETEWPELTSSGWNRLCPLESSREVADVIVTAKGRKGEDVQLYGNGKTSEQVLERLVSWKR